MLLIAKYIHKHTVWNWRVKQKLTRKRRRELMCKMKDANYHRNNERKKLSTSNSGRITYIMFFSLSSVHFVLLAKCRAYNSQSQVIVIIVVCCCLHVANETLHIKSVKWTAATALKVVPFLARSRCSTYAACACGRRAREQQQQQQKCCLLW